MTVVSFANPHRGEVPIELAGRRYVLRPSYEAIAEIEAKSGESFGACIHRAGQLSLRHIVWILAAGLRAGGEAGVTEEAVGRLVVETGIAHVGEPILAFYKNALTGGREPKEPPKGEAEAAVPA